MFAAKNLRFTTQPAAVPITFDAAGAGVASHATTQSYSHTIAGTANAIVLMFAYYFGSAGNPSVTATVGGVSMTSLGFSTPTFDGSFGYVSQVALGLLNPPTGTVTVSVTCTVASFTAVNTVSYKNVTSFGTAVTNTATSSTTSTGAVTSATNKRVVSGHTSNPVFSSPSGTSRYNLNGVGGTNQSLLIQDAPGAASVTLTATMASSNVWGAIAVPLN